MHTTHPHSLLAMDFLTSIFYPVSPATAEYETTEREDPVDRKDNPYGFCVVA